MKESQRKAMFSQAQKQKAINDYIDQHEVIKKLTQRNYSDISKGEYVRKVRKYHNTIDRYQKIYGTKPNDVIDMA